MEKRSGSVENKRTSKRRSKRKIIRKIIIRLIIFLLVAVGLVYFLTSFEAFNIEDIQIEGTNHYQKEEIEKVFNIKYGNNIFKQMYSIRKCNYEKLAYIEDIKISMVSNKVLKLIFTERDAKYVVFNKENSKYYRLNEDGVILEECNVSKKDEDEVIILGISFDDDVVIGSKIDDIYLTKIKSFLLIKEEYEKTDLTKYGKITKVNFSNSLTTLTINDKLNVILQDEKNIKYNLSLLQGILEKLSDGATGTIDMTKPNPVYSQY